MELLERIKMYEPLFDQWNIEELLIVSGDIAWFRVSNTYKDVDPKVMKVKTIYARQELESQELINDLEYSLHRVLEQYNIKNIEMTNYLDEEHYYIEEGSKIIGIDVCLLTNLDNIEETLEVPKTVEGIYDLGIKYFAIVSNGETYKNINKSARLKKLEKQLRRKQRCLSRKYENLKKGEAIQRKNIQKQKRKVQRLHHRINNIRTDYINKTIAELVKTKPSYITIEDLNVSGMMKNRHLSKTVASQKFYEFRTKLKSKCDDNGIELRIADRWYPSSKLCHRCGCIKKDLKLSDRIYRCGCGYIEDRDFNAALNLRDAMTYKIA